MELRFILIDGAVEGNRTLDLTLTKGVLYHWATTAKYKQDNGRNKDLLQGGIAMVLRKN